eukprot:m.153903 g.153903  ORF g.153903 m.153903 type:complete len:150 (+) comp24609_c0_seq3:291-740(+)
MAPVLNNEPPVARSFVLNHLRLGPFVRLAWRKSVSWQTKTLWATATWQHNPSSYVFENGTMLVISQRWQKKQGSDYKDNLVMTASHFLGLYSYVTKNTTGNLVVGDDPGISRTKRGFHRVAYSYGFNRGDITWSQLEPTFGANVFLPGG